MTTQAPVKTPTVTPSPRVEPDPTRRYSPEHDHCPGQWVRTTRRIRKV